MKKTANNTAHKEFYPQKSSTVPSKRSADNTQKELPLNLILSVTTAISYTFLNIFTSIGSKIQTVNPMIWLNIYV
ncbi:MAG: hypothetical protein LBT20_02245, partial [Clostridiales bacterium]|nr:hypothetical protein [Clostridiales bacterium]